MSDRTEPPDVCDGFVPQPCISYTNCTMSGFITNWTEFCCQPTAVKNTKTLMLTVIGSSGIIGIVCNLITISTFLYLYFFPHRIRRKFNQEFTMTQDPVFFLILHLSFCDLLHCVAGLPTYWSVYYYGYYPYSEALCKYSAFFRNTIALVDFNTLALISAYFAWRRGQGMPHNGYGRWLVLSSIPAIWIYVFCINFFNLFEVCGKYGYDAVHGMCHIITCWKCSEESSFYWPTGGHIVIFGIVVPFLVMLVSYSLVYKTLSEAAVADVETWSQRRAVMILTFCYFIFILPLTISELLPENVSTKAVIRVGIYCWYWLIYIVNFFIYIIFWRRIRTAITLMIKDIMEIAGWEIPATSEPGSSTTCWWTKMQAL